jgi:uracil-DNA glycosylase
LEGILAKLDPNSILSSLRQELDKIPFENASLIPFKGKPVMKRGFFPGGNGLFDGEDASHFPFDGTLVLGSNFGSAAKFIGPDGRLITQDETSNTTWSPLRRLLGEAEIDPRECFFTNAWPCLHDGPGNTVNKLIPKWLQNAELMKHCTKLFVRTCAEIKPSLIVALGPGPSAFLADTWRKELDAWGANTIGGIDRLPIGTVQLENVDHKTVCVAVVHPSYQHINAKLRRPPYQNADGEIELLKEAHERRQAALRDAFG